MNQQYLEEALDHIEKGDTNCNYEPEDMQIYQSENIAYGNTLYPDDLPVDVVCHDCFSRDVWRRF